MKKTLSVLLIIGILLICVFAYTSCSVRPFKYDYAVIYFHDGSNIKVELDSLYINTQNYDNAYVIFGSDGTGYLVGDENCILIDEADVDINASILSGSIGKKIQYREAVIKKPDGEIVVFDLDDGENDAFNDDFSNLEGDYYRTSMNNLWIKFTYED